MYLRQRAWWLFCVGGGGISKACKFPSVGCVEYVQERYKGQVEETDKLRGAHLASFYIHPPSAGPSRGERTNLCVPNKAYDLVSISWRERVPTNHRREAQETHAVMPMTNGIPGGRS